MIEASEDVPRFERRFFDPQRRISRIGDGPLGGKERGLVTAARVVEARRKEIEAPGLTLDVPALAVVTAEVFDTFLDRNHLRQLLAENPPPAAVADAFRNAALPAEWLGDLRALAQDARVPLACRSSSILEDALGRPFAGVYGTKMIPGNQGDADGRFRALADAVRFAFASAFSPSARAYQRAAGQLPEPERMAVVVQEVVGVRHGERFYPDISGVARSYSFYPVGPARPEEGVVDLAVGLGKTIVDGGLCWSFSPAHPRIGPPAASARDRVKTTQSQLWALNLAKPLRYDPMMETEYLTQADLAEAEADGTLRYAASTYDADSDRLTPGLSRPGPRVLDFAPIVLWDELPLVPMLRRILSACEDELSLPVEIEFAVSLPPRGPGRLGLVQVRPLLVSHADVAIAEDELGERALVVSEAALGNGRHEMRDVVYVEPAGFEARSTPAIAGEIEALDRTLRELGRPYLLIGFGRWGSSDPWLGIPVRWDQIAGARGIVEATLPQMNVEPSQGSHFFHNLSSFGVLYFTVAHDRGRGVDWSWLERQPTVARTEHVRHVRSQEPLVAKADGRRRLGVVVRSGER